MDPLAYNFERFKKPELHELADQLLTCDPIAIEWSVTFLEKETRGVWHGRARAMMARRLKHCPLSDRQRSRLLRVILDRLVRGEFSEQFKDQLRLTLELDPEQVSTVASKCLNAPAAHVRRYAAWVLSRKAAASGAEQRAAAERPS